MISAFLYKSDDLKFKYDMPFTIRCDLSGFITTQGRNHWGRRKETKRSMRNKVQTEKCDWKRKAIWNWYRERRRMSYLFGDEQQSYVAKLQPFFVYEMLQWLVSNCK